MADEGNPQVETAPTPAEPELAQPEVAVAVETKKAEELNGTTPADATQEHEVAKDAPAEGTLYFSLFILDYFVSNIC